MSSRKAVLVLLILGSALLGCGSGATAGSGPSTHAATHSTTAQKPSAAFLSACLAQHPELGGIQPRDEGGARLSADDAIKVARTANGLLVHAPAFAEYGDVAHPESQGGLAQPAWMVGFTGMKILADQGGMPAPGATPGEPRYATGMVVFVEDGTGQVSLVTFCDQ